MRTLLALAAIVLAVLNVVPVHADPCPTGWFCEVDPCSIIDEACDALADQEECVADGEVCAPIKIYDDTSREPVGIVGCDVFSPLRESCSVMILASPYDQEGEGYQRKGVCTGSCG